MRRLILVLALPVALPFAGSGCALNGVFSPAELMPASFIYTNVKGPNALATMGLRTGADSPGQPSKTGRSSVFSVLGLFSTGDASIDAAMLNGKITRVHHVDFEHTLILFGIVNSHTTIVVGN